VQEELPHVVTDSSL